MVYNIYIYIYIGLTEGNTNKQDKRAFPNSSETNKIRDRNIRQRAKEGKPNPTTKGIHRRIDTNPIKHKDPDRVLPR